MAKPPAPSLAPYIVVGLVAAVPLLALSAAAPGGEMWRWLEMPRHVTALACFLGLVLGAGDHLGRAAAVPLATVGIDALFSMVADRGAPELVFEEAITRLAPWLLGTAYGVLAALTIRRSGEPRRNWGRAGGWLAILGAVAIVLVLSNESWLTLENIGNRGTFRSSTPWPDTKAIAIVLAGLATASGLVLALISLRRPPDRLPRAIVR